MLDNGFVKWMLEEITLNMNISPYCVLVAFENYSLGHIVLDKSFKILILLKKNVLSSYVLQA